MKEVRKWICFASILFKNKKKTFFMTFSSLLKSSLNLLRHPHKTPLKFFPFVYCKQVYSCCCLAISLNELFSIICENWMILQIVFACFLSPTLFYVRKLNENERNLQQIDSLVEKLFYCALCIAVEWKLEGSKKSFKLVHFLLVELLQLFMANPLWIQSI